MSYGYTISVARKIHAADNSKLGCQLGAYCLKHNIPVTEVAAEFGVTRRTIYSWFFGKHDITRHTYREIARRIMQS